MGNDPESTKTASLPKSNYFVYEISTESDHYFWNNAATNKNH